jgi:hypothetical protein
VAVCKYSGTPLKAPSGGPRSGMGRFRDVLEVATPVAVVEPIALDCRLCVNAFVRLLRSDASWSTVVTSKGSIKNCVTMSSTRLPNSAKLVLAMERDDSRRPKALACEAKSHI